MFRPGEAVFLPGASGEPAGAAAELLATSGARVLTSFVPGVNRLPGGWAPDASVAGPFAYPGTAYRPLPMAYSAFGRYLAGPASLDTLVLQVAPPDARGLCSLGPVAEFSPMILRRRPRLVAVVNPRVPRCVRAPAIPLSAFAELLERYAPLVTYGAGEPDAASAAIAAAIAPFITDGAALQIGIGKTPGALMRALTDRRGLRLHSGMLSDGARDLVEAGCLDPGFAHVTTMFLGSAKLYDWVALQTAIDIVGVEITHDPARLAAIDGLIAVNSALEVDLLGQCNLETAAGRQVSGAGGSPDFARAGRLSRGGLSVIALPATFGGGSGSRIRARLGEESVVTLSRTEVDLIVTEHGAADLRGLAADARAEAIIAIAAPSVRGDLADHWREIRERLGGAEKSG